MATIQVPASKNSGAALGPLGTIIGAGVGAYFGGGNPAAIGAGAGLGTAAGSLLAAGGNSGQNSLISSESQGMQNASNATDYISQLREAQAASRDLPDKSFGWAKKAFDEALLIAERNRQMSLENTGGYV